MALAWKIELSDHQIAELTDCRDHHPKPYMRERAAAILKVAQAQPARLVATQGLLKTRQAHTVGRWLNSYHSQGLAGLQIKQGRGRKAAFSPSLSH